MINKYKVKKYCSEDISLIENYLKAIADKTQTWECHHRLECVDGIFTSPTELEKKGLYWKRPANELIFLTKAEHKKIHCNDPEFKKKMSEAMKGENNGMLGKHHTEEAKEKNRQAHLGKKLSEEAKIKIGKALSKAQKGQRLGYHFWNNGIICKFCKEKPGAEWSPGRLKHS